MASKLSLRLQAPDLDPLPALLEPVFELRLLPLRSFA